VSQQVERFSLFDDLLENGTVEKKSVSVDFSGLLQRIDFTPVLPSQSVSDFKNKNVPTNREPVLPEAKRSNKNSSGQQRIDPSAPQAPIARK
jgi:hypothetical protein